MKRRFLVGSGVLVVALLAIFGRMPERQGLPVGAMVVEAAGRPGLADQKAVLDEYCGECHNKTSRIAGLAIDELDLARVSLNVAQWEKIVRKLRAGMMPPAGQDRPDPATYKGLVTWLENELDRTASPFMPPPGVHRLNRTEYGNAVRDLLDLDIDVAKYLPSDDSTHGFDNMAGTLGISSTLVEAYALAGQKISRLAMGTPATPKQVVIRAAEDSSQDYYIEGLPFGTRGGMLIPHIFPSDGEYSVTITPIFGDNMSPTGFGSVSGEKLDVLLDGERLQLINWTPNAGRNQAPPMQVRFKTTAGPHELGVTFPATNLAPLLDYNKHFMRDTVQTGPTPGYTFFPHVGTVRIDGPINATAAQDSPSRRRIFVCRPSLDGLDGAPSDEAACAQKIVAHLAEQAYRRPVTAADTNELMRFFEQGRKGADFDSGIENALARLLAGFKFVYRMEAEPATAKDGQSYRLRDTELAARLSFFLWSTGPDAELRRIAAQGKLNDPGTLERQVKRMLKDPRSIALAENFAGQWLNLRGLDSTSPLPMLYPDFDDPLRQAMRREVELLFDSIVREDRSVVDLLSADYTFLNERLAKHYGIRGIYGSQFRRVPLGAEFDVRRGLLGKVALLATSAKPDRTSPVTRGKWIITNLLGVSPPQPPPNIPPLPPRPNDVRGNAQEPTMRQKMLDHRVREDCIRCHSLMDPIGFSLENFDAIALWRTQDVGQPIRTSEVLYDGTKVEGPAGLRQWLIGYSDTFVRVTTEKMLAYALGRGATPEERNARRKQTQSILDSVRGELAGLKRELGAGDRRRVDDYAAEVRDIERRIELAASASAVVPGLDEPQGIPSDFDKHIKMHFDLTALAFKADITRVATLLGARDLTGAVYPFPKGELFPDGGRSVSFHSGSHHQDEAKQLADFAKLNRYHVSTMSYFAQQLKLIPDGDGNLLDRSLILYGTNMGNSNQHQHFDVGHVLVGGANGNLKGGRSLNYERRSVTTGNVLLSVLDMFGIHQERQGDSTGRLPRL